MLAALVLRRVIESRHEGRVAGRTAKKDLVRAIEEVAQALGNTPSVCRKCYVHPAVIDRYLDGTLVEGLARR